MIDSDIEINTDKEKIIKLISAVSKERYELSDKLAAFLAPVMNEIHGRNYSLRFWKMLMLPYINTAISKQLFNEKREILTKPGLTAINDFRPLTTKEVLKANLIRYIKFLFTFFNKGRNIKTLEKENNLLLGFAEMENAKQELGKPLHEYHYFFPGAGNTDRRAIVNKIADRQENVFYKNLIRQLPQLYIEFFEKAMDTVPLYNPAGKVFHLHFIQSEYAEFLIAKYIEHGAKLYWYQHGACYGEYAHHNAHYSESSLADKYRTWGWKIKNNDEPWRSYRLEEFDKQYSKAPKSKKYDFLICFPVLVRTNDPNRAMTEYLLKNIDDNKYHLFLARPRPLNKIFSHAKQLSFLKHDKRVVIDSGLKDMVEVMAASRLVIQFYVPCTNFLECIYTDHPTTGILMNKEPTDLVKPYYDFFLKTGVLHYTPESLVNHLNKIDIDEWWQTVITHPTYREFKMLYTGKN